MTTTPIKRRYTRYCRHCPDHAPFIATHWLRSYCYKPECAAKEKERKRIEGNTRTREYKRKKYIKRPHLKGTVSHWRRKEDMVDKVCSHCGEPYRDVTCLDFKRPPGSKPESGTCPTCKKNFEISHYSEADFGIAIPGV